MTPSVPLVAHYNGTSGRREISLRVIAITAQNVMLVLWENKLIPVHQPIPGLTLDRVELFVEPPAAVTNLTNEAKKPGRPKKVVEATSEESGE